MNLEGLILQDWVRWSETWGKSKNSLRGASSCPMARRNTSQDQKMGGIRVGGQRPQYDGTDAVNYQWVAAYVGDIHFPHIKFLEGGWNEYDETNPACVTRWWMRQEFMFPVELKRVGIGRTLLQLQEWCILNIGIWSATSIMLCRRLFLSKCWQYSYWWLFENDF
jgi:hypothetical protein